MRELKEIQKSATEATDMVAELSKKSCEVAVRLHTLIEVAVRLHTSIEEIKDGE